MNEHKLSSTLSSKLAEEEGMMELVVELHAAPAPAGTRAEKMAAMKSSYEAQSKPVIDKVHELGGEVTGQTWLNATMRVSVPKESVASLSDSEQVSRLDVPSAITPD